MPGAEHIGNSSACTRQIEHSGRLWIEGAQQQQRVESWPVCFLTSRLPKYVSWRLDPEVLLSDALTINWTTFMGYAFSPFHFILAVLSKVSWDQADIILVAPLWKALVPPLLGLLVDHPVLLPSTRHLLADPASPQNIHPMFHLLHLAVFHISGDSTRQWDFLTTLPRFSLQQLTPQHRKRINQLGDARVAGVIDERSILFLQH